jgi:hypothetical protein
MSRVIQRDFFLAHELRTFLRGQKISISGEFPGGGASRRNEFADGVNITGRAARSSAREKSPGSASPPSDNDVARTQPAGDY